MVSSVLTQIAAPIFAENRTQAVATLAEELIRNRYVGRFRTVGPLELSAIIDRVLDDYGNWSGGNERALAACLDFLEDICFALSIPLAETAYALYVLRDGIQALLSEGSQTENGDAIPQINSFFEGLVRDLLRRY